MPEVDSSALAIDDARLTVPRAIVALATDYPAACHYPPHSHRRAQLVYAAEGVVTVTAEDGTWIAPPQRAIWIPAGLAHATSMNGPVRFRTLFIDPEASPDLPSTCTVVTVSPLLRELILRAVALPTLYEESGSEGRLMAVILDEIRALPTTPLHLPAARDPRLVRVTESLLANPGDRRTIDAWAVLAGASGRTLNRLFLRDTGMNFRDWRQQLRLLKAVTWLAEKRPVTTIALDLGYESPSAFIATFKRLLGTTPAHYFRNRDKPAS